MNSRHFLSAFSTILFLFMVMAARFTVVAQGLDLTWVEKIPVVELTYDASAFNTETFIPATFTFNSVEGSNEYHCTIRHRGGSSTVFAKPNYAIKFYDQSGNSLDVSFLDMRSDNHWILDAAAGDHSKIRNRASMDLWLDFSQKPYHSEKEPKAINGTRGRFVEVYVNGGYYGLFCLSEKVDRKQLKLKKFATDQQTGQPYYRGLLYKALYSDNTRTPFFYYNKDVPSSDLLQEWDGMKNEYPDIRDNEPWSWDPLLTSVKKVAFNSSSFMSNVEKHFDVPVFIDYVLFVDLMCAFDNVGKNYYCWFYDYSSGDKRMGYTPWDMDATWGRNWAGEPTESDRVMNNRSNFHARMSASYDGYEDILRDRYHDLRHTFWAEDSLFAYFDCYFDLFEETGVMEREYQRWKNSNCRIHQIAEEKTFIHDWIHDRLIYLDEEYNYDPSYYPAAVEFIKREEPDVMSFDLFGHPVSSDAKGWVIQHGKLSFKVSR